MRAKKSLGQNFLMHARIAERIASVAPIDAESTVLEIGPGTGMLTRPLLARARKVIAVEADPELSSKMKGALAKEIGEGRLDLVEGDIRAFDPDSIAGDYSIVANIPYYLTGLIFEKFLSASHQPRSMTMLVQKEVAKRIARDEKESLSSLAVKAYGIPKYEFTVPRGAFVPAPNVDSAVLSIKDISRNNFKTAKIEKRFFDLLHAGFAHKRKLLVNNLAGAGLSTSNLPPKARAEDLPLAEWLHLAEE